MHFHCLLFLTQSVGPCATTCTLQCGPSPHWPSPTECLGGVVRGYPQIQLQTCPGRNSRCHALLQGQSPCGEEGLLGKRVVGPGCQVVGSGHLRPHGTSLEPGLQALQHAPKAHGTSPTNTNSNIQFLELQEATAGHLPPSVGPF